MERLSTSCLGEKCVFRVALLIGLVRCKYHAQIGFLRVLFIVGGCGSRNRWPVYWWRLVPGHESAPLEPAGHCDGFGVGSVIRTHGSICLDGVGFHAWSCSCRAGLVEPAITAQYMLVMGVFWFTPSGLGTGSYEPVAAGRFNRDQNLQASKAGSVKSYAARGWMVAVFMVAESCSMASEWWWPGFNLLGRL